MSPVTLTNKCAELAQRLEWAAEVVTWKKGDQRGVEIHLARKRPAQELIPHVMVTFPGCGQILFRAKGRGCFFHILDLQVDEGGEEGGA